MNEVCLAAAVPPHQSFGEFGIMFCIYFPPNYGCANMKHGVVSCIGMPESNRTAIISRASRPLRLAVGPALALASLVRVLLAGSVAVGSALTHHSHTPAFRPRPLFAPKLEAPLCNVRYVCRSPAARREAAAQRSKRTVSHLATTHVRGMHI